MKLAFLAALGCAISTPALAQTTFNGPYVGVSAGYAAAKSKSDVALADDWSIEPTALQDTVIAGWSDKQSTDGVAFGAQLGYNAQVGGNVVIGAEASFNVLDTDETSTRNVVYSPSLNYDFTNKIDAKNLLALKAKLGFAAGSTLIYATGGWATGKADIGASVLSNGGYAKAGGKSKWMDGYIVGGGVEYKLNQNVSARLEYNYADLGHETYDTAYLAGSTYAPPGALYSETFRQDLRLHLVSLGVNYHF
ncbi:MAG: outer membrane beta-barrel protein [Novosphingobium sp.]|nr:outer membrane beta-barrel protein [Novosphingobium sp.]